MSSSIKQDHDFHQSHSLPESFQAAPPTGVSGPSIVTADWRAMYPETIELPRKPLALKERAEDLHRDSPVDEFDSTYKSSPRDTIQPSDILQLPTEIQDDRSVLQNTLSDPVSIKVMQSEISDTGLDSAAHAARLSPRVKAEGRCASAWDAITEVIKGALAGDRAPAQNNDPALRDNPEWSLSRHKTSPERDCQHSPDSTVSHTGPDTSPGDSPSPSESSSDAEAQRKAIEVLETLHRFGYIVQKDPNHSTKPFNPGSVASSKSENVVTCQKCQRFKGRPCELRYHLLLSMYYSTLMEIRKHMKRHSRPYGCTFPACKNKTFGSKNDWKRHENSQHFHSESWRCDEEKLSGGVCAKVCYRKQVFTDHLQKEHSISDSSAVASKVQACHIGRNSQARFWCGFCAKLIDLKKKSVEAWAERFDHIDDHFMGRHGLIPRSIQDWVPVDSHDMPKQDVLPLRDSDPTQSHENPEDSPQSLEPKSSNGSSPEPTDLAGPSSGNSSNLASTKGGVKRKRTEDGENGSPEKQRRRTYADDAFIYCVRSCT
jgi:hypothetical protein